MVDLISGKERLQLGGDFNLRQLEAIVQEIKPAL